jgi:hypothetical protein
LTLKAGESFHNPSKHLHNAKNPDSSQPAKVLVFLIGEKGALLFSSVARAGRR